MNDDVRIFSFINHIVFEFEETIVVSRLIERIFPYRSDAFQRL